MPPSALWKQNENLKSWRIKAMYTEPLMLNSFYKRIIQ